MTKIVKNIIMPDGTVLSLSGLPNGGTIRQVLTKVSNEDGDVDWIDDAGIQTDEVDGETITFSDNLLTAIGVKTKSGQIKYDWIGTYQEWSDLRYAGMIPDSWICFITDDGRDAVPAEDVRVFATVDYVVDALNTKVDPVQAELTEYKEINNENVHLLQESNTDLIARVSTIESAFNVALDEINGEVI